jgi:hypothetical protein
MPVTVKDNRKAQDALMARLRELGKFRVKVGFLADHGGAADHGGISLVQLATLYEFGSEGGRIAEHSFLRASIDSSRADIDIFMAKLVTQIVEGKLTAEKAYGLLALKVQSIVKNYISRNQVTPHTKGGQGTTLVDTGQLLNGVQSAVVPR